MDQAAAATKVRAFLELLRLHDSLPSNPFEATEDPRRSGLRSQINTMRPAIEAIASAVGGDYLEVIQTGLDGAYKSGIPGCERLLGAIEADPEIQAILGPQGPKLAAGNMHPWVWDHAAGLWEAGNPREAVRAAAVAIFDFHLPTTLAVPKDTNPEAMAGAFKTDPPAPGQPRFRVEGFSEGTEDYRNVQQGAQHLGLACAKLVRNLSAHTVEDHDEDEALEELAMLSRFARLVNRSRIETA